MNHPIGRCEQCDEDLARVEDRWIIERDGLQFCDEDCADAYDRTVAGDR